MVLEEEEEQVVVLRYARENEWSNKDQDHFLRELWA
jgi:hypothetical protein